MGGLLSREKDGGHSMYSTSAERLLESERDSRKEFLGRRLLNSHH